MDNVERRLFTGCAGMRGVAGGIQGGVRRNVGGNVGEKGRENVRGNVILALADNSTSRTYKLARGCTMVFENE